MDTAGGKGAHEGREFVLFWSCCSARAASAPPCMADVNFPNEAGLWNACVQWESSEAHLPERQYASAEQNGA